MFSVTFLDVSKLIKLCLEWMRDIFAKLRITALDEALSNAIADLE